jgi:DNA-binding MarR family transcriptional regulator
MDPANASFLRTTLSAQAAVLSELIAAYLEDPLHRAGLNLGTFELLSAVRATHGQGTQVEIARRLGITPASLSEAVKAAAGKGLIEQVGAEEDRRAKRLQLTDKGAKLLQRVLDELRLAEQTMVRGISSDQVQIALTVLRQATVNLAKTMQGP